MWQSSFTHWAFLAPLIYTLKHSLHFAFFLIYHIYIIYIVLLSYILCLVLVELGCTIKYWKKSFPTFEYIEKRPFQGQDVISIAAVLLCLVLLLKLWHLYYSVIFLGRVIRFQVTQLALILAYNDPDFSILLPRALECWDCKCVLLCLIYAVLGIEPRTLPMSGKHSTSRATFSALYQYSCICCVEHPCCLNSLCWSLNILLAFVLLKENDQNNWMHVAWKNNIEGFLMIETIPTHSFV